MEDEIRAVPIRMSGVMRESIVDGPGIRYVLFVQGCPHRCEGCHNPQTHDPAGGYESTVGRLYDDIMIQKLIAGITLSGGEPFSQPEPLALLIRALHEKRPGLSVFAYSGYTLEELLAMGKERPAVRELLALCDRLVDGRFIERQKDLTLTFRGSKNQRILDVPASLREDTAVLDSQCE